MAKYKAKIAEDGEEVNGRKHNYKDIKFPNEVPVTVGYDSETIVGKANNFRKEEKDIVCELELNKKAGMSLAKEGLEVGPKLLGESDEEEVHAEEILSVTFMFNPAIENSYLKRLIGK